MPSARPTLLNSSARAATASELKFRIQARGTWQRAARVIAIDDVAAGLLNRIAPKGEQASRFLVFDRVADAVSADATRDVILRRLDGDGEVALSDELHDADFIFMVATGGSGALAAAVIGEACWRRSVTTGAVVIGQPIRSAEAVAAIRPHARVLLVTEEQDDVLALLTALRVMQ